MILQKPDDFPGKFFTDTRNLFGDLSCRSFPQPGDRAEGLKECRFPAFSDIGDLVQKRILDRPQPEEPVVGNGKAVGFIPDGL